MSRSVVLVESPYSWHGIEAVRYLSCCLLDSVLRGEAPIASHAVYPLCLPERAKVFDGNTGQEIGLECRDSLAAMRHIICYRYVDIGVTRGMFRAGNYGYDRKLCGEALRIWEAGEWPSKTRWSTTNE